MRDDLTPIISAIVDSYDTVGAINHMDGPNLPSRPSIRRILNDLQALIFPGFQSEEHIARHNARFLVAERVGSLAGRLSEEIFRSLCFHHGICRETEDTEPYREESRKITFSFLEEIPEIRRRLRLDVQAALEGDPAARSTEEIILAYPGLEAIMAHRLAHELWIREVPLIPRMMSEEIHGRTGIDIHPGATIGDSFFIDHATGVVVGESTIIGAHVKVYQGVTIGALSVHKRDANKKRHPTIEDNVTIYAGATILGGETTIGHNSIIGGNVWITSSVPPFSRIYSRAGEFQARRDKPRTGDFQI
ncbi:serine acetyltransferase [Alkalispirochaeta sphaeroplastigenens]|uniref:Serine acetyltransferase n=1 Tax=Alkalispirochaeta sphaeroplastigenens TaxID=1187066 RepID=A0A2S4JFF1_9SPIO|nr:MULTISPECIES: serine O-acetyltransferase EpsC [Alkalispirochaeta]POQ98288.1 serine acetyltransferase [Alkalispirochaeta sphaeroplastigenens]